MIAARPSIATGRRRLVAAAAVIGGAAMLVWPAVINGFPIVFSDTAALAAMGLEPNMGWDKPWVYGPLILLLHWGVSLWGVAAGQALVTSAMLWLVAHIATVAGPLRHLCLCAVLAVGTALPWFVPFVMPDIFAPLTVLCLYYLGWGRLGRGGLAAVAGLATLAVASHLAHLVIAAACLVPVAVLRTRRLPVCALPLVAALAWLVGSNLVGNGVVGVSPYGSVFALARLQADGPAADYLHRVCPEAGYRLCAWSDRLPMESDAFLWDPDGPIWGGGSGPTLVAPEASRIVAATLREQPLQALQHAAHNTLRQLFRTDIGDTLGPQYLLDTVGLLMRTFFPVAEQARFLAARQLAGTLDAVAAPLLPLHRAVLALGALGTVAVLLLAWRRRGALAGLAAIVLVGAAANAFATGALSTPHDRYGARIAWLLVLAPCLALLGGVLRRRPSRAGWLRRRSSPPPPVTAAPAARIR